MTATCHRPPGRLLLTRLHATRFLAARLFGLLAGLAALAIAPGAAAAPVPDGLPAYTVSVVPQMSAADIDRDWQPVLRRLGERIGARLTLKVTASIPRFEQTLWSGEPDLAYMNPYHQVLAHRAHRYEPVVRDEQALTGILVVRADDPIRSVRELDGKDVAFPAPNAFGASLWMRALLAEREGIAIRPRYVRTHSNTYRQVLVGHAAAGGGVNNTLARERPEVREALRVLLETPGVAPHPLAAHPRVPAPVRAAIVAALQAMALDPADAPLLEAINMARPVAADYDRDYRPLEAYRLDAYVVLEP